MLRLVAENAALEDAMYYLDQGLTDGVVSMDVFLREVRRLSRKQFLARATMKKVQDEGEGIRKCESHVRGSRWQAPAVCCGKTCGAYC